MSDWISVEDRLPEPYDHVLVVNDGMVGLCCYNKVYGFNNIYFGMKLPNAHNITHWMPVPPPPEDT